MPHIAPIVISVWCGTTKPTDLNEFLTQFVNELNRLLANPISINNYMITVKIRCFILDTPARAFIKGIVHHTSYLGCQKCMAEGVYFRKYSKIAFPRIAITDQEREKELRTDARFRSRYQPGHHKENSLIEKLPIDMVRDFVVSDSLHLLDLGIIKR